MEIHAPIIVADRSASLRESLSTYLLPFGSSDAVTDGAEVLEGYHRRYLKEINPYLMVVMGPSIRHAAAQEVIEHIRWYEALCNLHTIVRFLVLDKGLSQNQTPRPAADGIHWIPMDSGRAAMVAIAEKISWPKNSGIAVEPS